MQPLRQKSQRGQVSRVSTLPCPTKGWYVGSNLAEAPAGTCYVLNNAFPGIDYIRGRGGCTAWSTGMPSGIVGTLMRWTNGTAEKMFAVRNGAIYDCSSAGAVGAALVTGLSNDYWQFTQYAGTGGTFLIAANGVDTVQLWNGSTWGTTPAITGLTGNPLNSPFVFKSRLYFVEQSALNAWYLPLDSIGGSATVFPLGPIFRFGGALVAGGTWTIESSTGLYQACCFVSSEGEVAIYTGDYPGATNWTLIGVYKVSRPLGPRCLMQAGGDLAILTEDGIVPMSKVESLDQVALQNYAITLPIMPAWQQAVQARQGLPGWSLTMWPIQTMAVVNLPKANTGDRTQYVSNSRTGAWSQYLGWDANCFIVFQENLFFGTSDGRVMQAETSGLDDTTPYTMTIWPAFSDLGAPGVQKHLRLVRPLFQENFFGPAQISAKVDFDSSAVVPPTAATGILPGAPLWDVAQWDVATWPLSGVNFSQWQALVGDGYTVSPVFQVTIAQTATPIIKLTTTDILYELGNSI